MKGGKLLSEGGFGCVFNPSMKCDGSSDSEKHVSKIQRYDNSAKNEITIGNILLNIPEYRNHFAPVISHCNIDIGQIKDRDKTKCMLFKKKKTSKYVLMKLDYIEGMEFLQYMVKNANSVQIINNIINSFNHILRSISLLVTKKLIHYDLKGSNILYSTRKKMPLIIDFGLSINMNNIDNINLNEIFYTYAPQYYVWPLEVHYLGLLFNVEKEPNEEALKNLAKSYVENNKGINKNFSPNFLKKFEKKCLEQLKLYSQMAFNERVKYLMNFWNTWDNYALSITYLRFLKYLALKGFYENSFIKFMGKLLLQNIHPDPTKRLSLIDTTHTFNGFLYKEQIDVDSTFEELTDEFIKNKENINKKIKKQEKFDIHETKTMKVEKRRRIKTIAI
jgi:serine/threonine protein kinase